MRVSRLEFELTRKICTRKNDFLSNSNLFELSEFELPGVNYYKIYYQIQGKFDLDQVSGEFDLSGSELIAGFNCSNKYALSHPLYATYAAGIVVCESCETKQY